MDISFEKSIVFRDHILWSGSQYGNTWESTLSKVQARHLALHPYAGIALPPAGEVSLG